MDSKNWKNHLSMLLKRGKPLETNAKILYANCLNEDSDILTGNIRYVRRECKNGTNCDCCKVENLESGYYSPTDYDSEDEISPSYLELCDECSKYNNLDIYF